MVLAGPLAGIAFFVVIAFFCMYQYGSIAGFGVVKWMISSKFSVDHETAVAFSTMHWATFHLLHSLVAFNFWWSLVNLLPVHPLDGGQIYATFEKSQLKVHQVGAITGAATAVIGWIIFQDWWVAILFGVLAYLNYQKFQQFKNPWK